MSKTVLSRRTFLVSATLASGGLALGFAIGGAQAAPAGGELNAWLLIRPDDTVVIRVAKSEMGQGVLTSLPMLVAEELDCDWSKVTTEMASAARSRREDDVYGRMRTGGSSSVRGSQEMLRTAGAAAKIMLLSAAAQEWDVPASELTVRDGVIRHEASGRETTYGAVAPAAAGLAPPDPGSVVLKRPEEWRLLGRPIPRRDTPSKVDGSAIYGIDVSLPGMLVAAVAMSPVRGGALRSFDASAVSSMPGVRHVLKVDGATVAVVADSYWRARTAVDVLPIEWDEGENGAFNSPDILADFQAALQEPGAVAHAAGDTDAGFARASRLIEAEYVAPYLAHAPMEPMNATAWVHDGRVEVWAPTQDPVQAIDFAAEAAGVDPSRVDVHVTLLGGGFGRRLAQDYVAMAVNIAKQVDGPVKMIWSREDDMRHGLYRPLSVVSFRAGLDEDGRITGWRNRIVNHSIIAGLAPDNIENGVDDSGVEGLSELPYDIPNQRIEYAMRSSNLPAFFWRSVGSSQNAFFKEAFIDELAFAAGQDPVAFRRAHLAHDARHRAVLDAAAERSGWEGQLAPGVHRGVALHECYDSVAAHVVEVSVDETGRPRVHRVVVAIDPGFVVNPDTARAQVEGAVIDGLSAALFGEITVENGRVVQGNFDEYELLRMAEAPSVEVHLVPSGAKWGGIGEPGLAPVAPALCNAIFAATGRRLRSLPVKNHDLRPA